MAAGPGALGGHGLELGARLLSSFDRVIWGRATASCPPVSVQGLAYSVSGGWNTAPIDHVGLFAAGGETATPDKLLAALRTALQVAGSMKQSTSTGLGPLDVQSTAVKDGKGNIEALPHEGGMLGRTRPVQVHAAPIPFISDLRLSSHL